MNPLTDVLCPVRKRGGVEFRWEGVGSCFAAEVLHCDVLGVQFDADTKEFCQEVEVCSKGAVLGSCGLAVEAQYCGVLWGLS